MRSRLFGELGRLRERFFPAEAAELRALDDQQRNDEWEAHPLIVALDSREDALHG